MLVNFFLPFVSVKLSSVSFPHGTVSKGIPHAYLACPVKIFFDIVMLLDIQVRKVACGFLNKQASINANIKKDKTCGTNSAVSNNNRYQTKLLLNANSKKHCQSNYLKHYLLS